MNLVFDLQTVLIALFLLTAIEVGAFHFSKRQYPAKHMVRSAIHLIIGHQLSFILSLAALNFFIYEHRVNLISTVTMAGIVLGLVLLDFIQYISHFLSHRMSFFWISHVVHHAPSRLSYLMSGTFSITSFFINPRVALLTPFVFMGLHPKLVIFYRGIYLLHQIFIHSEITPKLGIIEYIFNTPSQHRVHHNVALDMQRKNLGAVLSIFDRIFGTYQEERATISKFGLSDIEDDNSIFFLFKVEYNSWKLFAFDFYKKFFRPK